MQIHQKTLIVETHGKGLFPCTREIVTWVASTGVRQGLLTVFIQHTSASLVIQENADPDVVIDLADFFEQLVPEQRAYRHSTEGSDDMPAHIRSALTQTHLSIPVVDGRPALGTWQGIYVFEHRSGRFWRKLVLQILSARESVQ